MRGAPISGVFGGTVAKYAASRDWRSHILITGGLEQNWNFTEDLCALRKYILHSQYYKETLFAFFAG